jgi:hypothetical protein
MFACYLHAILIEVDPPGQLETAHFHRHFISEQICDNEQTEHFQIPLMTLTAQNASAPPKFDTKITEIHGAIAIAALLWPVARISIENSELLTH